MGVVMQYRLPTSPVICPQMEMTCWIKLATWHYLPVRNMVLFHAKMLVMQECNACSLIGNEMVERLYSDKGKDEGTATENFGEFV